MHVALDSNTLGLLVHPTEGKEPGACRAWVREIERAGAQLIVPEIADYELRRELVFIGSGKPLARLDDFQRRHRFLVITSTMLRCAADLWADARKSGTPTADRKSLDVDVILAAQVQLYAAAFDTPVILATTNVRHLGQFVDARPWQVIQPGQRPGHGSCLPASPFQVEREQPFQNRLIADVVRPAVGVQHSGVDRLVRQIEPRRPPRNAGHPFTHASRFPAARAL